MEEKVYIGVENLKEFVSGILKKVGVKKKYAEIVADVLVSADRRGIPSHGVQRFKRCIDEIKAGRILPNNPPKIEKETKVSLLVDGQAGLGHVIGYLVMERVIKKAKKSGICFACVRNSSHYGIAGYYAMMALPHNLIGISMTNSDTLVVPTFAKDMIIGTNPIAVAVPTKNERPWVLDMATATVPRGKVEIYARMGKKMPLVWATDEDGNPTEDAQRVVINLKEKKGGGLLPLGGAEEETGGHKGYNLSVLVDILSGILSGAAYGNYVYKEKNPNIGHFFGAIDPEIFIGVDKLKERMDDYIKMLKNAPKRVGKDRIYVAGEKEYEKEEEYKEKVPILKNVYDEILNIAKEVGYKGELKILS